MKPLVILHAPSHGPTLSRKAIRHALSLGADVIDWTEAYGRIPFLSTRPLWRITVGKSTSDRRRGAKDNPILTRRRFKRISWKAYRACGPSEPRKIAPERWTTSVTIQHPIGVVTVVGLHPNAAVQGKGLDVDRVAKYAQQMRHLERDMLGIDARGELGVVAGDLNFHDVPADAHWAPRNVFERRGWHYVNRELDWVAWSKGLALDGPPRFIPPSENGQDHWWIRVCLKRLGR